MALASIADTSNSTPLNMPETKFKSNIEEYIGTEDPHLMELRLRDLLRRYRITEQTLESQHERFITKISEMNDAIDAIKRLDKYKKKKMDKGENADLKLFFELAETLRLEAIIPPTDTVCIWLGADTLLEYPIPEALEVLEKNIEKAEKNHEKHKTDMIWLRDQITKAEVNIARLHNFKVTKRQEEKEKNEKEEADVN